MNREQKRANPGHATSIRWMYIKEQKQVSIQISPLVIVNLPFDIFEDGYKQMKLRHEQKIISLDN